MSEALRYVVVSLALGVVAVWASENMFWTSPPPDVSLPSFLLTWLLYAAAAGAALSAVIWTGITGLRAAFLGGAILGFLIEGVVVGTMYDAFPFQMVWTPLAWHALVSSVLYFAIGRSTSVLGPRRVALIWAAAGLVGAYWGQFWPSERDVMPGTGTLLVYLVLPAGIVALAQITLDRLGPVPRPNRRVLLILPTLFALVWVVKAILYPTPVRIALPLMLVLLLWTMRRLATGEAPTFGPPGRQPWHHGLVLIAPILVAVLAPLGWQANLGTLEANAVVALSTGFFSLGWLIRLVWLAVRRPQAAKAASAAPRSSAPS